MNFLDIVWADPRNPKRVGLLCVFGYVLLALAVLSAGYARLIPDTITYIQLARHYAQGEWGLALNSWYSPLFSWMLVPGIALGIDPLLWARLLQIPAGLGLAWGVGALVRDFGQPRGARFASILALLASLTLQSASPTPDLWHATVLTWYLVLSLRLLKGGGWSLAFLTGLVGGLAYLIKAYSLPFVCGHLAITFGLRLIAPMGDSFAVLVGRGAMALVGTLVCSAPWIALISSHEHEFLINSAGKYWTVSQPLDPTQLAPCLQLRPVRAGRLSNMENMRELPIEWKPAPTFGGRGAARELFKNGVHNATEIATALDRLDGVGVVKAILLLSLVLVLPLRETLRDPARLRLLWGILSIGLYLGGYALVFFTDRYLWPLWGFLLMFCVVAPELARVLFRASTSSGSEAPNCRPDPARRAHAVVLLGLGVLLLLQVVSAFAKDLRGSSAILANELRRVGRTLPAGKAFASSDYFSGLALAYWSHGVFLGVVTNSTAEGISRELNALGPVTVVVTDQGSVAKALSASSNFKVLDPKSPMVTAFDLAH